jgi:beta-mannosidase
VSTRVIALGRGWTLTQHRRSDGAPAIEPVAATVPGCVHTDLLDAGLIPDPFADTNEADLAWVADCDWRYGCVVECGPDVIGRSRVELVFDGLDTLATVTFNGVEIARTENMHRRYRFDVTGLVRAGSNDLSIVFASAAQYCERRRVTEGEWPSASFGRPFNHLRKMACSWGWDWGPALTTAGIWRSASLQAWDVARLGDVRPHPTVDVDDHGTVDVDVDVETAVETAHVGGPDDPDLRVRATLHDPAGIPVGRAEAPCGAATRIRLDAGTVERWWPHTSGDQPRYELVTELVDSDGQVLDTDRRRIGFHTIELDTTPDDRGAAFTFVVNGSPIFVRGVNWIPDDVFVTRITDADYRERLEQAVAADVDMIRVWGGGIYEDDRFYDLCDELGLLVWQDFAFACAAYPEHLLADEVEAEAVDNVSRLMHHPAVAIWNGNNENIWGYWDWGWEDALEGRSWGAGFYHELLPRVCGDLDPNRPYWPGSPYSGSDVVAPNADAHGCIHEWEVWNRVDLIRYRDRTPRFVAEFGWQSPPSMTTFEAAVGEPSRNRQSAAWLSHQKADDGDLKLDRGIRSRFGRVDDFEAFWYAAHVVQARAVRTGIEHFRSLRPSCMGTIWWQLNDCWPVTSWSVIDGAGRRKPAWYALREAYRSRLLTVQPRGDALVVFAVNDGVDTWRVDTHARRVGFDGTVVASMPVELTVAPRSSTSVVLSPEVAAAHEPTGEVLVVGDGDDRAWWWFAPDRQLRLTPPRLDVSATPATIGTTPGVELRIVSDVVVRELTIYPERLVPAATVSHQLLDLLPGEPVTIEVAGVSEAEVSPLLAPPRCWSVADLVGG